MRLKLSFALVLLGCLAVLLPCGFAEPRAGWNLAARLPASTIAFLSVEQLDQMQARLEATAIGRLIADPAMQEFLAPLSKAAEEAAGPDLLPAPVMDALKHLEHLRGQLAVGFVGMDESTGPQIVASLDFGAHVAEFAEFLQKLLAEVGGDDVKVEVGTQDGRPLWTIAIRQGPTIAATILDTTFVAATDPALLAAVAGGATEGSLALSADYQAVQKRFGGGEGLAFQLYGNVPAALATFGRGFDGQGRALADAMGLDTVKAVGYGMSFAGDGFRDSFVLHTPGADHGYMTMFTTAPLERSRLLDLVPGNAFFFSEANVGLDSYISGLRKFMTTLDPDMGEQMDEGLAQANKMLGLDIEKDLIGGLAGTLGWYGGLSSGGGLFPELAMLTTVKDPAAYEALLVRAMEGIAGAVNESGEVIARPRELLYEGQKLHLMELQMARGDDVVPFTPSWALLGDRLVVTLVPYTLKDVIYRARHPERAGPGLKEQEDFQALWAQKPAAACSVGYLDFQALLTLLYDTGVPLLQAAVKPNVLGEMGAHLPLDFAALPPVRHVRPYFRSVGMYQVFNRDGLEMHLSAPIPMLPIALVAVGVGAATMLATRRGAMESMPGIPLIMVDPEEPVTAEIATVRARVQLEELVRYVSLFVLERGELPASLEALVKAGYLEALPEDPWGRPVLLIVFDAAKRDFRLVSVGPDGEEKSPDDILAGPR